MSTRGVKWQHGRSRRRLQLLTFGYPRQRTPTQSPPTNSPYHTKLQIQHKSHRIRFHSKHHLYRPGVALSTQHGRIRASRSPRHGLRSPERAMERYRGQGWHQIELEHLPLIAHGTLSANLHTELFLTASLYRKPRDWSSPSELSTHHSRRRPTRRCFSMSQSLASSPVALS